MVSKTHLSKFVVSSLVDSVPIAIVYAASHPDRVSHLVLLEGWSRFGDYSDSRSFQGEISLRGRDWCLHTETLGKVLIGPEFVLATLEGVSELSGDRLLEELEEAAAAGVIVEVPSGLGRYRFSNALVRETLHDSLALAQRILFRRVGQVLERRDAADPEPHLAEPYPDAYSAAQWCHALIIAPNHSQFKELDLERIGHWVQSAVHLAAAISSISIGCLARASAPSVPSTHLRREATERCSG